MYEKREMAEEKYVKELTVGITQIVLIGTYHDGTISIEKTLRKYKTHELAVEGRMDRSREYGVDEKTLKDFTGMGIQQLFEIGIRVVYKIGPAMLEGLLEDEWDMDTVLGIKYATLDFRDCWMARNLWFLAKRRERLLAVVGIDHLYGISFYLTHPNILFYRLQEYAKKRRPAGFSLEYPVDEPIGVYLLTNSELLYVGELKPII